MFSKEIDFSQKDATGSMFRRINMFFWRKRYIPGLLASVVIVFVLMKQLGNVGSASDDSSHPALGVGEAEREIPSPLLLIDPLNHPVNSAHGNRRFEMKNGGFYINGKKIRLLSGAMHYFRVMPQYWEDRMKKLKAAGLNTLETYIPWNMHEEQQGTFNFKGILDVREYIKMAQSMGLYVILRPGPYICSEWEFGGLPSWLLRNERMQVRANYKPFLEAVQRYFRELFHQIVDLQFNRGGPIIMFQIENEYGSFGSDVQYMLALKTMMLDLGVREQLFTSDNSGGLSKLDVPGVFKTANFKEAKTGTQLLRYLRQTQTDLPFMVMEFWSGWFDHWHGDHQTMSSQTFENSLNFILDSGASVNFYMFHGGTNFGFMNGKNGVNPDVTSYDYDAPVSENGDVTDKFYIIRKLILKHKLNDTVLPPIPPNIPSTSYGALSVDKMLSLGSILNLVHPIESKVLVNMEMLDLNQRNGQSLGFILYRHSVPRVQKIQIEGRMEDRAIIFLNGKEIVVFEEHEHAGKRHFTVDLVDTPGLKDNNVLDILIENTGRITWGSGNVFNEQCKGLGGSVKADLYDLGSWKIFPLEFKSEFMQIAAESTAWQPYTSMGSTPGLFRFILHIESHLMPQDTFIDMDGWTKGVVFVNGFNLGRYWSVGPQQTLYLPAPVLIPGYNQIIVFELHKPSSKISLVRRPILQ